jgi:hypothetical protein
MKNDECQITNDKWFGYERPVINPVPNIVIQIFGVESEFLVVYSAPPTQTIRYLKLSSPRPTTLLVRHAYQSSSFRMRTICT